MPDTILQTEAAPVFRPLDKLAAALAKAQGEMSGASKDTTNPHFNRKYADLASVWNTIREPLTKNGLSVVQLLRSVQGGVEVETILLHVSGQQISDVFGVPASKSDAQGYGSAATYARRYALMAMVGVAPEDDDGNAAVDGHKPGVPGSASGGGQFRPARRSPGMAQTESLRVDPADRDMVQGDGRNQYEADKAKKATPAARTGPLGGREATAEEAIAARNKASVDKRIDALKRGAPWTRDGLDQFWKADEKWIGWMADPNNKAMVEYQRFLDAFSDAEVNVKPVELA